MLYKLIVGKRTPPTITTLPNYSKYFIYEICIPKNAWRERSTLAHPSNIKYK